MATVVSRPMARGTVYRVRYRDPRTKRPREVTVGENRAEAEAYARRVETDVERRAAPRSPDKASSVYRAWQEHLRSVKELRPASLRAYDSKVGRVVRALDSTPLHRWTPRSILGWIRSQPVGARTKVAFHVTTGTFLRWADGAGYPVPSGLVAELKRADRPTPRRVDRATLTEGQVRSILRASVGTGLEVPVHLAALAGLAWGDIQTLRWDEVDLEAGTLWRRQGRAKTGARLRVALAPELVAVLRAHRHAGPVVCDLAGSHRQARALLAAIWEAAAVPRTKGDAFHALRHAFGSHLGSLGVPLPVIAALMGHTPGSTVTLRYLHPVTEDVTRAAAALGARFAPATGKAAAGPLSATASP